MHSELTNLLPATRQRAVAREYFVRFGVVAVWFITALSLAGALLLIPTYILLIANAQAKQNYLSSAESAPSAQAASLSAKLAELNSESSALIALSKEPSISGILRQTLAFSRPGIVLSNFDYTPAKNGKPGTLLIAGTAATRDALRNYQLTLQSAPFAKAASLPVSAYAKDANIGFLITVTLAP